ncbi:MAG: hypothetical protein HUJ68_07735 [Clostridia bacterium]|nr:hypothetical protein [Clostridia bacterium]
MFKKILFFMSLALVFVSCIPISEVPEVEKEVESSNDEEFEYDWLPESILKTNVKLLYPEVTWEECEHEDYKDFVGKVYYNPKCKKYVEVEYKKSEDEEDSYYYSLKWGENYDDLGHIRWFSTDKKYIIVGTRYEHCRLYKLVEN